MGKKAKSKKQSKRAELRKLDPSTLPDPPPPPSEEIGSAKLLDKPSTPGSVYKVLDKDGYDDGGVGDLTMVIDLDDNVLRRKRGETAFFQAVKADILPRIKNGNYAQLPRRDQKVRLANLLFTGEDDEDETMPTEVYMERHVENDTEKEKAAKLERLRQAKFALKMSTVLREPSASSLCLTEISKRYLTAFGKAKAEDALRCAEKAIEIASDGYYDSDEIAMEADEEPKVNPKYDKNATSPGLLHATSLQYQSPRVAHLCLRSAYLHHGNALSALGRHEEARQSYERIFPYLEKEHRCGRVDWERSSAYVNIGNSFSREGNLEKAIEYYRKSEQLGKDHLAVEKGNKKDGIGIVIVSKRAEAFALNKAGKTDEGKAVLKTVLEMKEEHNKEIENDRKLQEELAEQEVKENEENVPEAEELK